MCLYFLYDLQKHCESTECFARVVELTKKWVKNPRGFLTYFTRILEVCQKSARIFDVPLKSARIFEYVKNSRIYLNFKFDILSWSKISVFHTVGKLIFSRSQNRFPILNPLGISLAIHHRIPRGFSNCGTKSARIFDVRQKSARIFKVPQKSARIFEVP